MQDSTKIKYFTIVGTFIIIFTSYFLHAKTYYVALQPANEVMIKKTVFEDVPSKILAKVEEVELKPIIEKAKVIVEPTEELKVTLERTKPEPIEIVNVEIPIKHIESIVKKVETAKEVAVAKKIENFEIKKYLYLDNNSKVSNESKKIIEDMRLELDSLGSEYYIEVEGYSSAEISSVLSQQLSEEYAQSVAMYLKSIGIKKKVVVTGHSDIYPIIGDKFDRRNSRVELKIREEKN